MQLDRAEVEALARIRTDPGLSPYKLFLVKRLERARDECTRYTGDQLAWAQGRAQEIQQQLKLIEESSALLEKVMQQK